MAILFAKNPGVVVVASDPMVQGLLPVIGRIGDAGDPLDFASRKCFFVSLGMRQATNFQFMHTLGGDIYLYVFGDEIGTLNLSGLAVSTNCENPGDTEHGIGKMLKWYKANRIVAREEPLQYVVGGVVFDGYLTGMDMKMYDPGMQLVQFDLSIALVPEA